MRTAFDRWLTTDPREAPEPGDYTGPTCDCGERISPTCEVHVPSRHCPKCRGAKSPHAWVCPACAITATVR